MAKPLKRSIENLKNSIKNLKQEVEAKVAADGGNQAENINFEGRSNIQVSQNIGQPGSITTSEANQETRIDQNSSRQ